MALAEKTASGGVVARRKGGVERRSSDQRQQLLSQGNEFGNARGFALEKAEVIPAP